MRRPVPPEERRSEAKREEGRNPAQAAHGRKGVAPPRTAPERGAGRGEQGGAGGSSPAAPPSTYRALLLRRLRIAHASAPPRFRRRPLRMRGGRRSRPGESAAAEGGKPSLTGPSVERRSRPSPGPSYARREEVYETGALGKPPVKPSSRPALLSAPFSPPQKKCWPRINSVQAGLLPGAQQCRFYLNVCNWFHRLNHSSLPTIYI